jgi:hypothetical protein
MRNVKVAMLKRNRLVFMDFLAEIRMGRGDERIVG